MKALFPAGPVLFAMIACTPQQQQSPTGSLSGQWLGGGPGAAQVGGSAGNTTTAFDGTYQGISNRSASAASHLTSATGAGSKTAEPSTTGCQQFDTPPTLTVANGLAQFQAMGVTLQVM
jgi:hypothetical protein